MAENLNEEANSQSSQLAREKNLQKLVGDGGNNACSSSMTDSEVNGEFVFLEGNSLSLELHK